ncbi:MAG: helix-turn-helix transcriptional regulator [Planctomycetia bacterium]|nr:helix-turn-helix transcriptional regulator [Planctomycetia bacterium]
MTKQQSLSDQLRRFIRENETSQRQLAFKVGVDPAVLSKFLNGQGGLSTETFDKFGKLFGLTLNQASTPEDSVASRKGK